MKYKLHDPENRHPEDYYPTWPAATRALMENETFSPSVWEPACGEGDMVKVIEEYDKDAIWYSDLHDRMFGVSGVDFLSEELPDQPGYDIITNPPFGLAQEFVQRGLELTKPWRGKVAMFLRLAFLEGQKRGKWFPYTPLKTVYVMSRRVPMQRGRLPTPEEATKSGPMQFAWFVWDWKWDWEPNIEWLDWKNYERV